MSDFDLIRCGLASSRLADGFAGLGGMINQVELHGDRVVQPLQGQKVRPRPAVGELQEPAHRGHRADLQRELAKADCTGNARVIIEKPFGRDLASAKKLNEIVLGVFDEQQIYRIDHYLGKEAVQNLMALRFGNALFEPLWRRGLIKHVQITVAEELGVERRGQFYDKTGALRDMVQNHLLQLLCIMAMEPPASSDPDAVRDEKLKVARSGCAHQNGARPVQGRRSSRRARAGLS